MYIVIDMVYVVIKNNNEIKTCKTEKEVENTLKVKEGVFYVISVYSAYIAIEKYQVNDNKMYRIDSKLM